MTPLQRRYVSELSDELLVIIFQQFADSIESTED
jgi:hypothetical protein